MSVRVHCLALGGVDLTTPAGKMTVQVLAAAAAFKRAEAGKSGSLKRPLPT